MRTNIVIDEQLIKEAKRISALPTKRAVVEEGLRTLIRLKKQQSILELEGKIEWDGNLDEMRRSRGRRH